jgi:hypothetical protein
MHEVCVIASTPRLRAMLARGDKLVARAAEGFCVVLTEQVAGEPLDELTAWRVNQLGFVGAVEVALSPGGYPGGYPDELVAGARDVLGWFAGRAGDQPDLRHLEYDVDGEVNDDDEDDIDELARARAARRAVSTH